MNDYEVDRLEGDGAVARIMADMDPCSPRENDNLGTILGDDIGEERLPRYFYDYHDSVGELVREMRRDGASVVPLRFNDCGSSGATIHATDEDDANAMIYASAEDIEKEYGSRDRKARAAARRLMLCEVEEFSRYMSGEVYGIVVEDEDGRVLESCWGFIGDEYAKQEAREMLSWGEEEVRRERSAREDAACRDIVTV